MSRLVFTDRWHQYALDGKRVPSVTTVCRVMDKPGLDTWRVKQAAQWAATHAGEVDLMGEEAWTKAAAGAADVAMRAGGTRGRQLHLLAESMILGEPFPEADENGEPITDDVYASAKQLVAFFDAWDVEPIAREAFVFNDVHGWAGRLDLVADLRDGRRWLLDYKTGTGVYPDQSLQLAAYRHASHIVVGDRDLVMPPVDDVAVVWVRPDQWQLIPVRADLETYGVFLSLLPVLAWTKRKPDESVYPPLPVPEAG
jgi:hypothetical protein